MNRLLLIIVAVLCAAAFTKPIQACQCREYGTPICAQFWRSDAVFLGQVVDIKPLQKKPDNVYEYLMVTFLVQESFRGVSGNRFQVATATTMCDTKFKKGKPYLVFAVHDTGTDQFFTGMCSGTSLAYDIDNSLKELRKLTQREAEESIFGRIKSSRYAGLPGAKIEVIGKDKTLETTATKYGDFSLAVPGPGVFTVRVSVPYYAELMDNSDDVAVRSSRSETVSTFEYDVTLEKSQCNYLEIEVNGVDPRATATLGGNVLTASGQAVEQGVVHLVNTVEAKIDYVAILKKDGSFRFERVAPGEYYLVLNAKDEVPGQFDAPYARTYYPATENKDEAQKILITEGAVLENLTMSVGRRMSERSVSGRVVWKDGHRIEDAYLKVYAGYQYVRSVEVEENGTFKFILYGDFPYSIEALDSIDEIKGRSQRVTIPPGNSAPLKLVIQRIKP